MQKRLPGCNHQHQCWQGRNNAEDRAKDQIEYCNEDKWVREKFEGEMAKRGITSLMPPEAYTDPDFEWNWKPFVQQSQK